jgi:hypothetical protein
LIEHGQYRAITRSRNKNNSTYDSVNDDLKDSSTDSSNHVHDSTMDSRSQCDSDFASNISGILVKNHANDSDIDGDEDVSHLQSGVCSGDNVHIDFDLLIDAQEKIHANMYEQMVTTRHQLADINAQYALSKNSKRLVELERKRLETQLQSVKTGIKSVLQSSTQMQATLQRWNDAYRKSNVFIPKLDFILHQRNSNNKRYFDVNSAVDSSGTEVHNAGDDHQIHDIQCDTSNHSSVVGGGSIRNAKGKDQDTVALDLEQGALHRDARIQHVIQSYLSNPAILKSSFRLEPRHLKTVWQSSLSKQQQGKAMIASIPERVVRMEEEIRTRLKNRSDLQKKVADKQHLLDKQQQQQPQQMDTKHLASSNAIAMKSSSHRSDGGFNGKSDLANQMEDDLVGSHITLDHHKQENTINKYGVNAITSTPSSSTLVHASSLASTLSSSSTKVSSKQDSQPLLNSQHHMKSHPQEHDKHSNSSKQALFNPSTKHVITNAFTSLSKNSLNGNYTAQRFQRKSFIMHQNVQLQTGVTDKGSVFVHPTTSHQSSGIFDNVPVATSTVSSIHRQHSAILKQSSNQPVKQPTSSLQVTKNKTTSNSPNDTSALHANKLTRIPCASKASQASSGSCKPSGGIFDDDTPNPFNLVSKMSKQGVEWTIGSKRPKTASQTTFKQMMSHNHK